MSLKAKGPKEDPETKRRREIEQKRADAARFEETRGDVTREGLEIARQFGRRASLGNVGQAQMGSSSATSMGGISGFTNRYSGVRGALGQLSVGSA